MISRILRWGVALGLLVASGAAYADDPTGVLLQQRRAYHHYHHYGYHHYGYGYGGRPAFSDVGPCGPGTQSEAFPNAQGFRCVSR